MTNVINDETRIIRFLDLNGAQRSVGRVDSHYGLQFNFHYGLLSHYRNCEGAANDSNEGTTQIMLQHCIGNSHTCNEALISCWSIWHEDGSNNPWHSFQNSAFANDPENSYVISSTIGKVRRVFRQTVDIYKELVGDHFHSLILFDHDAPITYYSDGVDANHWQSIVNPHDGLGKETIANIFHKRRCNGNQYYDKEREYRFALILGIRRFFANAPGLAIEAKNLVMRDYPFIISEDEPHYIDGIYFNAQHSDNNRFCAQINTTCCRKKIQVKLI